MEKHAQVKRRLVWLPHPKPDDPIGDALRSAIPKESLAAMPGELKALLFILKALPDTLLLPDAADHPAVAKEARELVTP